MPGDDAVLVRRSRAGDGEAFGLLFEQYKNLVYRTAFLIVGTAADAEDILQEVFCRCTALWIPTILRVALSARRFIGSRSTVVSTGEEAVAPQTVWRAARIGPRAWYASQTRFWQIVIRSIVP